MNSEQFEQLKELINLFDSGILSVDEFKLAKSKLFEVMSTNPVSKHTHLSDHGWFTGGFIRGYQLTQMVGKGGFGVVWEARDANASSVAMKAVQVRDEEQRVRLMNEVEILKSLDSPFIVGLKEYFHIEDWMILVQEFIEGATLDNFVTRLHYDLKDIDDIASGLFEGLEVIHNNHLVHRDIKPRNVLLSRNDNCWHPKIIDFGIVRRLDKTTTDFHTQEGVAIGTPGFMAPEQYMTPANVDASSDIFALGSLLYFLVTRKRAFRGASHLEVLRKSCLGEYDHRLLEQSHIPNRIRSAIEHALQPSLGDRPKSIMEMSNIWFEHSVELDLVTTASLDISSFQQFLPSERRLYGRDQDIIALKKHLNQRQPVLLFGDSGVGKSALAYRVVSEYEQTHDLIVIELGKDETMHDFYIKCAQHFNVPIKNPSLNETISNVLSYKGDTFFLVDGTFDCGQALQTVMQEWTTDFDHVKCLVISRKRIDGFSKALEVGPLSLGSAQDYFLEVARRHDPFFDITSRNQADINVLISSTRGIPLRVELLAPHVANHGPNQLKHLIEKIYDAHAKGVISISIEQTVSWSFELLKPYAKEAIRQISIFKSDFDLEGAEHVLDLSVIEQTPLLMDVLHELESSGWLQVKSVHTLQRMHLHDSMRSFILKTYPTHSPELESRYISYFEGFATSMDERHHGANDAQSYLKLNAEIGNLHNAMELALNRGEVDKAGTCLSGINIDLKKQAVSTNACELFKAFPIYRVTQANIQKDLYRMWAWHLRESGDLKLAKQIYDNAIAVCDNNGFNKAGIYSDMSSMYYFANKHDLALKLGLKALELRLSETNPKNTGRIYDLLGLIYKSQGKLTESHKYFRLAIASLRQENLQIRLGIALSNYANVLLGDGQIQTALDMLFEAQSIYENTQSSVYLGQTLGNIGGIYSHLGQPEKALRYHYKALQIHKSLGRKMAEGVELSLLCLFLFLTV
ncbi:MAG: protein kinase [Myxococcota bacterium]|nr:protein kinase [Myxococcota bacterium]